MKRISSGVLKLALCLFATAAAAAPSYTVIDLGVKEAGEGLPWRELGSTQAPAWYPELSGGVGFVSAGNSVAVVGYTAFPDDRSWPATKWDVGAGGNIGNPIDLGVLPGGSKVGGPPAAEAYGVNRVGSVAGVSDSAYAGANPYSLQGTRHGFLWRDGVMTDLTPIAGHEYNSAAYGVNDSHEVVGYTDTISRITGEALGRAFVYIGETMYNLTFYLVGGPTVLLSTATAIDCQGNISAEGVPAAGGSLHSYLLLRQGAQRTCPK
jgi:probable HAF family extracellular repeat protein